MTPSLRDRAVRTAVALAESGAVPDAWLRRGIRNLCRGRLADERARAATRGGDPLAMLVESMRRSPIALAVERANEQHYELPPAFFERVLGPRQKYSCAWFDGPDEGASALAAAEEAMLARTCERADVRDGMRILDLGCGWGSLSLWIAERHPGCRVAAVSNSKAQREFVLARAAERGLDRVQVVTADANDFLPERHGDLPRAFDRVLSVEMFEHMRNWGALLARIRGWLAPGGRAFLHVFCHRELGYFYDDRGDGDWMARHFFTGGMMPAYGLLDRFADDLRVEARWHVDGSHYRRTALSWLENLDRARGDLLPLFAEVYGPADARRWLHRWRLFFLACAELFGFDDGGEWGVAHYRLAPVP